MVALSAGLFLNEFILRYPSDNSLYIFDEENVALLYLAVVLRSLFHIVAGVGIARIKLWVRGWLFLGWPITAIVTLGVSHALYQSWLEEGFVSQFLQSFAWLNVFLFMGWIGFDLFFVNNVIKKYNEDKAVQDVLKPIEGKKIAVILFIAVFSFCVLIFLGRPIKKGFHKGFYKSTGEISEKGQMKKVVTAATKKQPSVEESSQKDAAAKPSKQQPPLDLSFSTPKVVALPVDEGKVTEEAKIILDEKKGKQERGFPYRQLIGFAGGLCLMAGFLWQLLEIQQKNTNKLSVVSYLLFSLGFFSWIIYGISSKILPISLTAVVSFLLCVLIVVKCWNDR